MKYRMHPKDLRRIRADLGLSQQGLAAMLGTACGSVNRWEKGRFAPTGATHDLYLALDADLKRSGAANKIVDSSYLGRGEFLLGLFTLAYGTAKQRKGLEG